MSAGDILADALYCDYFTIGMRQAVGMDVLFEQHGVRITAELRYSTCRIGYPYQAAGEITTSSSS